MRKKPVQERSSGGEEGYGPAEWVDQEPGGTVFADERLGRRFRALLEQLSRSPGDSIPLVCQSSAFLRCGNHMNALFGFKAKLFRAISNQALRSSKATSASRIVTSQGSTVPPP